MITGDILRDAVISGANNISNNRQSVDELNVFPVPDGDTGTNMTLTITNAAKELAVVSGKNVTEVADITSSGLLRGARGNSGVILSLIFRGFAKGFKGKATADGEDLAVAMKSAVKSAYKAVMKPTEGTILTVIRVASEYADKAVESGTTDFVDVFEQALTGAKEALAQTPEMLPVLKKAGVVDAGGAGLVTIFDGMYSYLRDGKSVESAQKTVAATKAEQKATADDNNEPKFTYYTKYYIRRREGVETDTRALCSYLESIGDRVSVREVDDLIRARVYTDDPDKALAEGLKFGDIMRVKIDNLRVDSTAPAPAENTDGYTPAKPVDEYGFVAVAAGAGIESLFSDLGVNELVRGGQTMNPSTDDILRAVELTPAKTVFVLPNNKNIIMAAEQTIKLATRKVIVLQTKTVPQGIAAMLNFDASLGAEENAVMMQEAAGKVASGSITFAARDSEYDGYQIKQGEILALQEGKVAFVEQDAERALVKLTRNMFKKDSCFVTLIYGSDVSEEDAAKAEAALRAKLPADAEITLIPGGQPIYYYIISVE